MFFSSIVTAACIRRRRSFFDIHQPPLVGRLFASKDEEAGPLQKRHEAATTGSSPSHMCQKEQAAHVTTSEKNLLPLACDFEKNGSHKA